VLRGVDVAPEETPTEEQKSVLNSLPSIRYICIMPRESPISSAKKSYRLLRSSGWRF